METKSREDHISILANSIIESIKESEFRWDIFFNKWYKESGNPYFFLFRKNLSVTNLQFTELFSLLTNNTKSSYNSEKSIKLIFQSTSHVRNSFEKAINSLLEGYSEGDYKMVEDFSILYLDVFSKTIPVDLFFGSCAVFLTPTLDIDLGSLVHQSGYIHSAGRQIYIRNIAKARKPEFIGTLENYVSRLESKSKTPFVVYSHEDFSGFDNSSKDLLEKGLNSNKIYLEKMSMGRYRLSSIVLELVNNKKIKEKIIVAESGSFREKHKFNRPNSTIWLISDKSISSGNIKFSGQTRYYICYEQLYKSESPFIIFDENKPAWKSHTTLPHSLTASLINIAQPIVQKGNIVDPFGGTGTTWLETLRLKVKNKVVSSDLSTLAKRLHEDNLKFFLLPKKDIELLIIHVKSKITSREFHRVLDGEDEILRQLKLDLKTEVDPFFKALRILNEIKEEQPNEENEYFFSEKMKSKIESLEYRTRLYFYLLLKSEIRYKVGIRRKAVKLSTAFIRSAEKFINQLEIFLKLKKTIYKYGPDNKPYTILGGKYSKLVVPSLLFSTLESHGKVMTKQVFSNQNAIDLKPKSNSLIICDPPYGFNTTEDDAGLALLYSNFLDRAIDSLLPHGQLIMCVPAESYTGRDLPYCTSSDIISRQILLKTEEKNRFAYIPAKSLPNHEFFAPYYWEADKALRRAIIHFYIL